MHLFLTENALFSNEKMFAIIKIGKGVWESTKEDRGQSMKINQIGSRVRHRIQKWFHLGLEEGQYNKLGPYSEYSTTLAQENLDMLKAYCIGCIPLLVILMLLRCAVKGFVRMNVVPYALAIILLTAFTIFLYKKKTYQYMAKEMYVLIILFHILWYSLAFYFDIILQPQTPGTFSALVFVVLASVFNMYPKDNMFLSFTAYVIMILLELHFMQPGIAHTDAVNSGVAMMMGIAISQKKTSNVIRRKMYMDMYKAATKTSILVAQADIIRNTYEVLQCPDYMEQAMLTGKTAKECIDQIRDQFVAEPYRDEFMKVIDFQTISQRLSQENQVTFYFLDFRQRWCQLLIVEQKRINDKIAAIVAEVRDVDEERRREYAYQNQLNDAMEEAKIASAAKTSFLRRMSHDIRTPINGIRGMLEIAEHYQDDLAKQNECRQKIWDASGYLLSLVNDVLDMNKLESGMIVLEKEAFDLIELLSEANSVAEMQAMNHGIRYVVDKEHRRIEHPHLLGSTIHLKQILQNLASNAIKYNRENGTVTVRTQEISYDGETALFQFCCSDTGLGMSEAFVEHAFEPFAQEERSSNAKYSGTGLGLAIVKELVERMGGEISLESRIDKGTTFTLTIPFLVDHAPVIKEEEQKEQIDLTGKKALLVEDNELNMEIATFLLEKEGLIVVTAENGKEAVERFAASEEGEYSILFMDIMMPVMGGLEATEKIRSLARKDAKTVPIIAMSANAFQDDVARSLKAGMNDHLMKPLEMEKVRKAIQNVLG